MFFFSQNEFICTLLYFPTLLVTVFVIQKKKSLKKFRKDMYWVNIYVSKLIVNAWQTN